MRAISRYVLSVVVSSSMVLGCTGEIAGVRDTASAGASGSATGAAGGVTTGAAGTGACVSGAIPADVAAVIGTRCIACHGTPPIQGVPATLATYPQITAPSTSDPTKSVAALALARMQDAAKPMPPPPLMRATTAEVATFQAWIAAGAPPASCPDGGASDGGGAIPDPYATPPVCTSKTTWTRGEAGDPLMEPGMACVSCHAASGEPDAPKFSLAGTIYPTAHEPDLCNGGAATTGARVTIVGADGKTLTLTPNAAGNFSYEGVVATPYKAKVTYMGRERAMIDAQTSGDCNACHTQAGAMKAPGRIMLP